MLEVTPLFDPLWLWSLDLSSAPQESRSLLEEGVASLAGAGGGATDSQLGEAHLRLGRVYWELAGAFKEDRAFAHKQWLTSATLEGPSQAHPPARKALEACLISLLSTKTYF